MRSSVDCRNAVAMQLFLLSLLFLFVSISSYDDAKCIQRGFVKMGVEI